MFVFLSPFSSSAAIGCEHIKLLTRVFFVFVCIGRYIWNKGSIVGPSLKIPFMGPFLESVNPKFSEYLAKWNSGPLSCVSVFHKYVFICFRCFRGSWTLLPCLCVNC